MARLVVCVSSNSETQQHIIRKAARVADMHNAEWIALYVQTSDEQTDRIPLDAQRHLMSHLELVMQLGGQVQQVVSDNVYVRGTEEGNYQALRELPKVQMQPQIQTNKGADGQWTATVALENSSNTPALMIRVNVLGAKDGEQILPMFYSDNYFSLLPGEKKTVNIHWKDEDTRGEQPQIIVSGYNVQ